MGSGISSVNTHSTFHKNNSVQDDARSYRAKNDAVRLIMSNFKSIPILSCLLILFVKVSVPEQAQCLVVIA